MSLLYPPQAQNASKLPSRHVVSQLHSLLVMGGRRQEGAAPWIPGLCGIVARLGNFGLCFFVMRTAGSSGMGCYRLAGDRELVIIAIRTVARIIIEKELCVRF